jgi:ABC-type siderophore export system fused ATPase/permease subunit
MAEITSIYAKAGAQTTENTTQKVGIGLLWAKITAGAAHVVSLVAQTTAQWAFNVAEWAGCPPTIAFAAVILILVAALVAVVAIIGLAIAGIIALVKAIKANSPEGQLKSAEEAAQAAGEAAE